NSRVEDLRHLTSRVRHKSREHPARVSVPRSLPLAETRGRPSRGRLARTRCSGHEPACRTSSAALWFRKDLAKTSGAPQWGRGGNSGPCRKPRGTAQSGVAPSLSRTPRSFTNDQEPFLLLKNTAFMSSASTYNNKPLHP
uniref:Uncharacterized protein n=1 Tax=Mustela putorius furo TaxID=9669 RepID=M3YAQ2_MUSPF